MKLRGGSRGGTQVRCLLGLYKSAYAFFLPKIASAASMAAVEKKKRKEKTTTFDIDFMRSLAVAGINADAQQHFYTTVWLSTSLSQLLGVMWFPQKGSFDREPVTSKLAARVLQKLVNVSDMNMHTCMSDVWYFTGRWCQLNGQTNLK